MSRLIPYQLTLSFFAALSLSTAGLAYAQTNGIDSDAPMTTSAPITDNTPDMTEDRTPKPDKTELAQDTQVHDHDHDHSDHARDMPVPDIDHVFTEAPDDHAIGLETAPNTVIIYASVTCPHCSDWFTNQWPEFKSTYVDTGNTRVVFREFPTAPVPMAMAGFMIANCAPADKYFESVVYQMNEQKAFFERAQADEAQDAYLELAQKYGMADQAALQACFETNGNIDRINRALSRAQASKTDTVPAFYVNGERFKGDLRAEGFMTRAGNLNPGNTDNVPASAVE